MKAPQGLAGGELSVGSVNVCWMGWWIEMFFGVQSNDLVIVFLLLWGRLVSL